jgi:hypothetical protein
MMNELVLKMWCISLTEDITGILEEYSGEKWFHMKLPDADKWKREKDCVKFEWLELPL